MILKSFLGYIGWIRYLPFSEIIGEEELLFIKEYQINTNLCEVIAYKKEEYTPIDSKDKKYFFRILIAYKNLTQENILCLFGDDIKLLPIDYLEPIFNRYYEKVAYDFILEKELYDKFIKEEVLKYL